MADYATPSPDATPSPAETLRRAAYLIRYDAAFPATSPIEDPAVACAVADWLEQESRVTCHADNPTRIRALAVARAYLGGPA